MGAESVARRMLLGWGGLSGSLYGKFAVPRGVYANWVHVLSVVLRVCGGGLKGS